jgi:hypothetical protein
VEAAEQRQEQAEKQHADHAAAQMFLVQGHTWSVRHSEQQTDHRQSRDRSEQEALEADFPPLFSQLRELPT